MNTFASADLHFSSIPQFADGSDRHPAGRREDGAVGVLNRSIQWAVRRTSWKEPGPG